MFNFDRWCQWARSYCQQTLPNSVLLTFERGAPSPKQGASISFETGTKLMLLQFWETGESDFHGIDLPTGRAVIVFAGRILDDQSFEETVRECLAAVE